MTSIVKKHSQRRKSKFSILFSRNTADIRSALSNVLKGVKSGILRTVCADLKGRTTFRVALSLAKQGILWRNTK